MPPAAGTTENRSAGKNLSSNRGRFTIARQIGRSLKLRQPVEQQQDRAESRFGVEEVFHAEAIGAQVVLQLGDTVLHVGAPGSVKRHLHLKQRQRGCDEATYVESLLVLNALGGACLEDFDRLREEGPGGFIGFAVSARMSASLKQKIGLIPEAGWRPYQGDAEVICECAELPWDPVEHKAGDVLDEATAGVA